MSKVQGDEMTTYLLVMRDGTLKKVTVPASWKVTFGALYPGKDTNSGKTGLRFYSGQNKQHAVFTEVESFRDMSINIEERVTTTRKETYVKQGDEAGEAVVVDHSAHEWVNPDNPPKAQQPSRRPGALIGRVLE